MAANLDCVRNALELFKFNEMKIGNEIRFKTVCERETEENNRKRELSGWQYSGKTGKND